MNDFFEKGFVNLLVIFLLILGIGVGIFLVKTPKVFEPRAQNSTDSSCSSSNYQVSTFEEFKSCLNAAQSDPNITKIELTQPIFINCSSGSSCAARLNGRTSPLTIYGRSGTNAGFIRTQYYNFPLLVISNSNGVILKDLIFDDAVRNCTDTDPGNCNTAVNCDDTNPANCDSPIVLLDTQNNLIDHVTILHPKSHGIQIVHAFNLEIKNSIIYDANKNGIWFNSAYSDPCPDFRTCATDISKISSIVKIENNLIADSRIAAIEFYAYGNSQYHSQIKGNLLVHNHRDARLIFCPPQVEANPTFGIAEIRGGHCPGGQLAIARSFYLDVENNVIRDGRINSIKPLDNYDPLPGAAGAGLVYENLPDPYKLHSTGIEMSTQNQIITISNNKVYNNTGGGIFADYSGYKYSIGPVNISSNYIYGNSLNFGKASETNSDGSPYIPSSGNLGSNSDGYSISGSNTNPISLPKAFIFADPPVCQTISQGQQCSSMIRWYTEDYPNVSVTVNLAPGIVFGSGSNATNSAPWIGDGGAVFELRNAAINTILNTTLATTSFSFMPTPVPTIAPTPSPTKSPSPTPTPTSSPTPTPRPTPTPTATPKRGDLNSDDVVGVQDFAILLSKWKSTDPKADLDGDGIVGLVDFSILLSNWGT